MKVLNKRKQVEREDYDRIYIPYKKRLVCDFSNMSLEETPHFFEKTITENYIEIYHKRALSFDKNIDEEKSQINEAYKENFSKPYNLSWNDSVRNHIDQIIKPDYLIDKMIDYYEKEKYALVLYDEKKINNSFMPIHIQEIQEEKQEDSDSKGNINEDSCAFRFYESITPESMINRNSIEIEE